MYHMQSAVFGRDVGGKPAISGWTWFLPSLDSHYCIRKRIIPLTCTICNRRVLGGKKHADQGGISLPTSLDWDLSFKKKIMSLRPFVLSQSRDRCTRKQTLPFYKIECDSSIMIGSSLTIGNSDVVSVRLANSILDTESVSQNENENLHPESEYLKFFLLVFAIKIKI